MGFGSRSPGCKFWWFVLNFLCSFYFLCSAAKNNITQGQRITGKETLISSGQRFELGFFSPGNSTRRYLGIWYYKVSMQSVVWIANRQNPIIGEGGAFAFGENGELMVLDGNGQSVWSSHTSVTSGNATAILMDTGNFIIWNGDQNVDVNVALWQSFNHPTDTFLPEMKVKIPAAETPVFTAWRSADDPSPGQYSMGIDPRGPPQIVIWDGSRRRWRSGQFDGIIFTGVPNMPAIFSSGFRLLSEEDGDMYFIYHSSNISALLRFRIGWDGNEELQKWDEGRGVWNITQWQPANGCELYNKCGAFAICSVKDSRLCTCIEGFVPKNEDQWKGRNWTEGCIRRTELECQWNSSGIGADDGGGDGFRRIQGVKLPDFADFMTAANFDECRDKCLKNCSCLAYAFDRGINCLIWGGDLVDIQLFAQGGNDLYIRLAGSELGQENKISKVVIVVIVVIGAFCIVVSIWLLWRFRMKKKVAEIPNSQWKNNQLPAIDARSGEYLKDFSVAEELGVEGKQRTGPELFLFSFSDVAAATNNFSDIKKLGKGGFGPVFKGMLPGGEEIAVKRLSRMSGQGLEEFKNEIMLIAKLQHINLVRLLGCCIEGDERMLIYEYMPNNSLDSFLFDPFKRAQLDWEKRISIIEGIARGLLYLHRDSRLRIIHRDLKASNVLLDEDLNPKISDFGLAKIFRRNESEASTSRVVGTYGYMAPEYAMEGLFSVKSDVYSFGILLLEIVSGRRNSSFRSPEHSTMIGYVWDLWDGGKAIELVDPSIADSCCQSMALRCIHIAMLCVQDQAASRPTMAAILMMLESENSTLPMPRQPTFTSMRRSVDLDIWKDSHEIASSNDVSVSLIMGR